MGSCRRSRRWICTGDVWVRKQHRLRLGRLDEEGVHRAASRVVERDVEGLEVVPVRLHLRPLGDLVAHADEDVLQLFADLGDEVEVAGERAGSHFREIEPVGRQPVRPGRPGKLGAPDRNGFLDPAPEGVQSSAGALAAFRRQSPQLLVVPGVPRPLAEGIPFGRLELLERGGGPDR